MPIHPRFVHFPVALLFSGAVALLYAFVRGREDVARWGWPTLLIGWLSLIPAMLTGLVDQSTAGGSPAFVQTVNRHITAGIGLWIVVGYVLYKRLQARTPLPEASGRLVVLLLLGMGILVLTGEWGGRLAYVLRP